MRRSVFHGAIEDACRVRPQHPAFFVQLVHDPAAATAVVEPADQSLVAFTATDAALALLREALARALTAPETPLPNNINIIHNADDENEEAATHVIVVRDDSSEGLSTPPASPPLSPPPLSQPQPRQRPPLRPKAKSDPGTLAAMLADYLRADDGNDDRASHSDTDAASEDTRKRTATRATITSVDAQAAPSEGPCEPVPTDVLRYADVGPPAACALRREDLRDVVVLGQLDAKYIVARWRTLVLAFDQHAVHERIRLERLEADVFGADGTQRRCGTAAGRWLWPLGARDAARLTAYHAQVARWGFRWRAVREPGGTPAALVTQVPTVAGVALDAPALAAFLRALDASGGSPHTRPPAVAAILATRACRSAVRFGDTLSRAVCVRLLAALAACRLPFQCAHGRPSIHPLADVAAVRAYARAVAQASGEKVPETPPTPPPLCSDSGSGGCGG